MVSWFGNKKSGVISDVISTVHWCTNSALTSAEFPWTEVPLLGTNCLAMMIHMASIMRHQYFTCHDSSLVCFLHFLVLLFIPRIRVRNSQLKHIQRFRHADFVNNLSTHWNWRHLPVSSSCGAAAPHPGLTHFIHSAFSSTPTSAPAPTPASPPAPGFKNIFQQENLEIVCRRITCSCSYFEIHPSLSLLWHSTRPWSAEKWHH